MVEVDRNGLEVLPRAECMLLLAKATIGRVGVSSGALPTVLPVNYCLDEDRIVIRTVPGTKLDAALANAVVAFEVDDIDPIYHGGWSVVVTGRAFEIADPAELERLETVPVTPWIPSHHKNVIAISTDIVSGRRLRAHGGWP